MSNEFKPKNGIIIPTETASTVPYLDADKKITSSAITPTELGHLSSIDSNIQDQLNAVTGNIGTLQFDIHTLQFNVVILQSDVGDLQTAVGDLGTDKIDVTEKGANNGVATLDAGGKVPVSQLPSSVMEYKGVFDPATATFTDAAGDAGDVWRANAAGSYDAGSGPITYAVGDWAVHNGTIFELSPNSNAVMSVNGETGVVVLDKTDIGLGNVDNTSDATKNSATATLTNKTISGSNNTLSDIPQSAITNLSTDLTSKVDKSTFTTKGDLLVTTAASTVDRLGVGTDGQVLIADTGSAAGVKWSDPTGGSGQGGINYITHYDGSTLGDWTTYYDWTNVGPKPVNGTGSGPLVTFVSSTDSSMRGANNFLFTHDAANRQGHGFSYLMDIDPIDRGRILRFQFDYKIASGTYANGDLTVWFYDETNDTLIQGAPTSILNSGLTERFQSEVQIPISCAQLRAIIHVSTTTATAYTMRFDDFSFGPLEKNYGSQISDWVSYTPSGTWTTNTSYTGKWRRVGDVAEFEIVVSLTGAPNATHLAVNLPSGMTVDIAKISPSSENKNLGRTSIHEAGFHNFQGYVGYHTTSSVIFGCWPAGGSYLTSTAINSTTPMTFGNTDSVRAIFSVPIVGWSSSSQVVSDDYTSRPVAAKLYRAGTGQTVTSNVATKITLDTALLDSVGSFDSGNSRYTAKTPGYYRIVGQSTLASAISVYQCVTMIYVNGVETSANVNRAPHTYSPAQATNVTFLNVGDYVELYTSITGTGTLTMQNGGSWTYLTVDKIQGPSQVLAGETVAASYKNIAGTTISTAKPVVSFAVKDFDTHNAYNTSTGVYTIPVKGKYEIGGGVRTASTSWLANQGLILYIDVNNGAREIQVSANRHSAAGVFFLETNGKKQLELLAGDTIRIRVYSDPTTTLGIPTAPQEYNYFDIFKVGI